LGPPTDSLGLSVEKAPASTETDRGTQVVMDTNKGDDNEKTRSDSPVLIYVNASTSGFMRIFMASSASGLITWVTTVTFLVLHPYYNVYQL
jgi:hypothetical protein